MAGFIATDYNFIFYFIAGTITYTNSLQISNLTTERINGVSVDKFMTTTTNQSFDDFYARTLYIENLYAERVNGVPVEEAARKSRENIIKGNSLNSFLNIYL